MEKKVKMNKEKFKSLEQLDRIEYFLHKKDLENKYGGSMTMAMLILIFKVYFIITSLGLLFYLAFDITSLILLLEPMSKLFIYALIVSVVMDGVIMFLSIKNNKRLDDHFLKRGGFK